MNIKDFVDTSEDDGFFEEKQNLDINLNKVDEILNKNQLQIEDNKEEIASIPPNDYEYVEYKRNLLSENTILGNTNAKIKKLRSNLYFGRMKLEQGEEQIDMYIGEKSFTDLQNNQIVFDWRAPVSSLFYQNQEIYKYRGYEYKLNLKRKIAIENSQLIKCYDVYSKGKANQIVDKFLQKVLETKKNNDNFVDIIKTIQDKQNNIIRENLTKNVVVQGVAGSGKTVIILHRLSYILFNNPEISPKSFMFIAPTDIFKNKLNDINKKLQIDKINISTLSEYYAEKLSSVFYDKVKTRNDVKAVPWVLKVSKDEYSDNEYFIEKYSNNHYSNVISYYNKIFEEKITKFRAIFNFEEKTDDQKLRSYLSYIKLSSEDKIKALKEDCERRLLDAILLVQSELQKEIDNLETKDTVVKNFDAQSDLEKSFYIAESAIDKGLKSIEDVSGLNFSILEIRFEELKVEISRLYTSINEMLNSLNIKKKSFECSYSKEDFEEALFKIKKNITEQTKKSKSDLISIEKEIANKKGSLFNVFLKFKIEKLTSKKQTEENFLSLLSDILEKANNIEENYDFVSLFDEYSLCSYALQKRKNYLNLQNLSNELKKSVKHVMDFNGLIKSEEILHKIGNCISMINSLVENITSNKLLISSNSIEEVSSNFDKIYERNRSDFEKILKIKSEIIEEIEIVNKSSYVWNLYHKYLEDTDKIALDNYYSSRNKEISRVDAYLLLRISHDLGFLKGKNYSYIYIDEAQDYNDSEIKTIYLIEGKPTLNIYGDINQRIFENVHERKNWNSLVESISKEFNYYELNENYRNTVEIVDFCNKKLSLRMEAIGVSASNVDEYEFDSIDNVFDKATESNAVVITNNVVFIKKLKERKIRCCTVFQSKGLEFTDVIVIDENFSKSQKYVAYTRSLKNLTILLKD